MSDPPLYHIPHSRTTVIPQVLAAGNTQLSFAQARLYGLLDENGDPKEINSMQADTAAATAKRHQQTMESVKNLSEPREVDLSHVESEEKAEMVRCCVVLEGGVHSQTVYARCALVAAVCCSMTV